VLVTRARFGHESRTRATSSGCPLLTARLPCGTGENPLPLLPSGPDGVYGTALHRTRLSAIDIQTLQGFFNYRKTTTMQASNQGKRRILSSCWQYETVTDPGLGLQKFIRRPRKFNFFAQVIHVDAEILRLLLSIWPPHFPQ